MIEVKIPKEVREYEEKWLVGMTKRQLLGCLLAIVIDIPLYITLKNYIGSELAGWTAILAAVPFALLGFYKHEGLPFEKLLINIIKFHQISQRRIYRAENIYSLIKEGYSREENHNVKPKNKTKSKKEKRAKE